MTDELQDVRKRFVYIQSNYGENRHILV